MVDALDDLSRQLAGPIVDLADDKLVEALHQAEKIRAVSRARSGRLLAELHRRGYSWPEIARATGMRQTTVYEWAQPYQSAREVE